MVIQNYYKLTKPGIIKGNILVALAGFCLGSDGDIVANKLFWTLLGTSLVIAGGCVINNVLDSDIDKLMPRTQNRATATGKISKIRANIFGLGLTVLGLAALLKFVNLKTTLIGLIGWVTYVYVYTYAKRRTVYSTIIGGIAGATPPVAGYVAAVNDLDLVAVMLFSILSCWQIPHFYAISIFRFKEYKNTKLPIFAMRKGILATKKQIIVFCSLFVMIVPLLSLVGVSGWSYLIIMSLVSLSWLKLALTGLNAANDSIWAKSVFGHSIKVLSIFSLLLIFESILP